MRTTLTITSKGQTTIPVEIRKKLGISDDGGILSIDFNEQKGAAIITKPMSIELLSEIVSKNIQPGTVPVIDADSYYQEHRGKE